MTDDEKRQRLTQALKEPEGKYTHAEIQKRLDALTQSSTKSLLDAPKAPERDQFTKPGENENDFSPRVERGFASMGLPPAVGKAARWISEVPAMAINEGLDTASFGAYRKGADALAGATGVRVGPTPEMYKKLETDHPIAATAGKLGGDLVPIGGPAKVAKAVGRGVDRAVLDPLLSVLARQGAGAGGRMAAQGLAGALAGAGANAGVAGLRKATEGGDWPAIGQAALEAMPTGAAVGGPLAGLGAMGGEIARKLRGGNQDIQALARAGLEPSPIPGRPVVRADQPLSKQLPGMSEPPLGVGRVTPATRGKAGREAIDEIAPDIAARRKASNQRFGELQGEAYSAEGANPAQYKPILADIDRRLADDKLPDATRAALTAVRDRFERFIPKPPPPPPAPPPPTPEIESFQTMLAGAKSPMVRKELQKQIDAAQARLPKPPAPKPPPEPHPFTAKDLDSIRDYADTKVASGEIKKGDVQFLQLSELMRNQLGEVAPGIAKLNTMQSKVKSGRGKVQGLLGMKREQRGEGEDVYQAGARRVRERGEETATSGARTGKEGHDIERVGRMGPPLSLPGTKGLPDDPGYQSLLDIPRLQLAQENLQATPSKMFSGGGRTQLAQMLPLRVIYPLARRAGDAPLASGKTVAVGDLTDVVRRRREKKKQEHEARAERVRQEIRSGL